jgi:C2H2-type zinc finger protein
MGHLEGGQCQQAPMNRDEMYLLLRSRDPMRYFTKHIADFKPTERYEATASAFNHKTLAWHCYFCQRGFNCQNGLDNHLNSPVHQQALYHCPNKGQCGREFTTLAGVFNHLESESCSYMRFDVVQQKLENVTAGMGLLK